MTAEFRNDPGGDEKFQVHSSRVARKSIAL